MQKSAVDGCNADRAHGIPVMVCACGELWAEPSEFSCRDFVSTGFTTDPVENVIQMPWDLPAN